MSYSGGTFSINTAGQPVVAGTTISDTVFNALTADLATGLSTCVLKDGTQTTTALIPFAEGVALASTKRLYLDGVGGTGDTYILESAANTLGLVVGGTTAFSFTTVATLGMNVSLGANYISRAGTAAGLSLDASNNATISGTLTVSGATITTGSTTALSLATTGGTQVQVTNTATANRYITLTGSNGGNPNIGVSAGNLTLTANAVGFIGSTYLNTPGTDKYYLDNGSNTYIYEVGADILGFVGGGTERARITAGGYFKASNSGTYVNATGAYHEVYQTSDNYTLYASNALAAAWTAGSTIFVATFTAGAPDNNTALFLGCGDTGAARCNIYSDGDLANHDGTYGTISDLRFKPADSITPARSQWQDVKRLADKMINYETKFSPGKKLLGWGAQDVQAISPGVVHECKWGDEDALFTDDMTILKKGFKALGEVMARLEIVEARLA